MEIPIVHERTKTPDSSSSSSLSSTSPFLSHSRINGLSSSSSVHAGIPRSMSKTSSTNSRMTHQINALDSSALFDEFLTGNDSVSQSFLGTRNSGDDLNSLGLGLRSLHARLPSTDSGIQADAGFDSLSRYKGRHLLSSVAKFNQNHTPTKSLLNHSISTPEPFPSRNGIHSPEDTSTSGYFSDVSNLTPLTVSSSSPSSLFSPLELSFPVGKSHASSMKPIPIFDEKSKVNDTKGPHQPSISVTQNSSIPLKKELHCIKRNTSVPAVPPKPRVPVSRKPAFLGRGGKKSSLQGEETRVTTHAPPGTSLSLNSGIKVTSNEDGIQVRIPKPNGNPGNEDNKPSSSNNNSNQHNHHPVSSHNSTIDILPSKGPNVKIQIVSQTSSSTMPSTSSPGSMTSSVSTQPFPAPNSISIIPNNEKGKNIENVHLTRPLRLSVVSAPTTMTFSTATTTINAPSKCITTNQVTRPSKSKPSASNSHKSRVLAMSHPPPDPPTPSQRLAPSKELQHNSPNTDLTNPNYDKNNGSHFVDEQKIQLPQKQINDDSAIKYIPIQLPSSQQHIGTSLTLSNSKQNGVSFNKNSPPVPDLHKNGAIVNSKVSKINIDNGTSNLANQKRISDSFYKSANLSPKSNSNPTERIQKELKITTDNGTDSSTYRDLDTQNKIPSSIDSCIFRYSSPETTVFKQTFYDKNTNNEHQNHHQQEQQQQLREPPLPPQLQEPQNQASNCHPAPRPKSDYGGVQLRSSPSLSTRMDFLRKHLRPKENSNKDSFGYSFGKLYPDGESTSNIFKQTDDIFKEVSEFFNTRDEDEGWERLFSKSSFGDSDDLDKIFSQFWDKEEKDCDSLDSFFNRPTYRHNNDSGSENDRKSTWNSTSNRVSSSNSDDYKKVRERLKSSIEEGDSNKPNVDPGELSSEDLTSPTTTEHFKSDKESWKERKQRIDAALSWLQHELADLRAMDKAIVSQFRQCQDSIQSLQAQRDVWEGLEEEGEFWDDLEITEYNRRCQESPESFSLSLSPMSTGSREVSMAPSLPTELSSPDMNAKSLRSGNGVTQDVEITL